MSVIPQFTLALAGFAFACGGNTIQLDQHGSGGNGGNGGTGGAGQKEIPPNAFVPNQDLARAILVDATRVYWTTGMWAPEDSPSPGLVRSCLKDACDNSVVTYERRDYDPKSGSTYDSPFPKIALDEQSIYWVANLESGAQTIHSCPTAGCSAPNTVVAETFGVGGFVVSDGYVYWSSIDDSAIYRCPTSGCNRPSVVILNQAPDSLAADAQNLYWSDSGKVLRMKKDGSALPSVLARATAAGLVINGTYVFWIESGNRIMSCPLAGCESGPTALVTEEPASALFAGSTHAYWIKRDLNPTHTGSLRGLSLTGNALPTEVHTSQNFFWAGSQMIATDETHVYWIASGLPDTDGGFRSATIFRQPQ